MSWVWLLARLTRSNPPFAQVLRVRRRQVELVASGDPRRLRRRVARCGRRRDEPALLPTRVLGEWGLEVAHDQVRVERLDDVAEEVLAATRWEVARRRAHDDVADTRQGHGRRVRRRDGRGGCRRCGTRPPGDLPVATTGRRSSDGDEHPDQEHGRRGGGDEHPPSCPRAAATRIVPPQQERTGPAVRFLGVRPVPRRWARPTSASAGPIGDRP